MELDPAQLLADAPADGYALLELELDWPQLDAAHERLAAWLRLFVLTRDPLAWIPDRGAAWATVNADGDTGELVVYVRLDAIGGDLAEAGRYGAAAVHAAVAVEDLIVSGAHPSLAAKGKVARLLDRLDEPPALGTPVVKVRSDGWEPVGLGAIQDLVQDAFGPVDLDRAKVRLDPADVDDPDCPACRGERFGFPADLEMARLSMCSPHREVALAVSVARTTRARASNGLGWRAIGKASARISDVPEPGGVPLPPPMAHAPGRNDPCPCGSGRKYKRCCGA